MVQKSSSAPTDDKSAPHLRAHILIIEAPYYDDISGLLAEGALAECERRGMTYERIAVPGALEIPQVLAAAAAAREAGRKTFDGAVALGCVIRGETGHYDIVCNNANHWLMEIAVRNEVPVGNAILTVDTREQAIARAEGGVNGKGGDAVRACARLIETKRAFWGASA
ncbi:MAG: 6,7-dimethyl-8-ribityllumazine synthase [Hyphomicrobium denitrificans]|uniref:6,7-dimethyl-8-ribityllumazine synthase n=1 Tax=Hyphomicrobium denitrificans (strain ATCC 51888 / DSM 1869 / NCIMB 11706 / TK 0415) TaxID=582899 RepID=D8JUW3_HYPDA|nr:6,7-dimethyl-8-ribityllumazine synthase [Hyphomicrobium denitrificans]ADJ22779.1 6,7-dimethyl-8-ribityllumazine synthase [Hyphomicrobium denitrificans ATCC 51888]MBN9290380.1 6,7-dimethyl-8-ribityllumazine synthase [Hyphomicrobium denitrificans]